MLKIHILKLLSLKSQKPYIKAACVFYNFSATIFYFQKKAGTQLTILRKLKQDVKYHLIKEFHWQCASTLLNRNYMGSPIGKNTSFYSTLEHIRKMFGKYSSFFLPKEVKK